MTGSTTSSDPPAQAPASLPDRPRRRVLWLLGGILLGALVGGVAGLVCEKEGLLHRVLLFPTPTGLRPHVLVDLWGVLVGGPLGALAGAVIGAVVPRRSLWERVALVLLLGGLLAGSSWLFSALGVPFYLFCTGLLWFPLGMHALWKGTAPVPTGKPTRPGLARVAALLLTLLGLEALSAGSRALLHDQRCSRGMAGTWRLQSHDLMHTLTFHPDGTFEGSLTSSNKGLDRYLGEHRFKGTWAVRNGRFLGLVTTSANPAMPVGTSWSDEVLDVSPTTVTARDGSTGRVETFTRVADTGGK